MMHYLLSNAYSSISPVLNVAGAYRHMGGREYGSHHIFETLFGFGVGVFALFVVAFITVMVVSIWRVFKKAHQPGWASIIPIYNHLVVLRTIKKPEWWVLFMFVPVASIILMFSMSYHLAKAFGKGTGFALGMLFLPFIFYPILAFGKAHYTAPHESANLL